MELKKLSDAMNTDKPITALLYCAPGVGKSTALGIIAEQSQGRTLVLDTDRTFINAMAKMEVVHDLSKIDVVEVDNIHTFSSWTNLLVELDEMSKAGKLDYENICVDNISELERCILSDLGSQGKNKGVPAQGDYQYMQFKLVNSLRFMKSWKKNIYWTAWETTELFQNPDGSSYSRQYPKINGKIVDNICGLCDIVAKIAVAKDGRRGFILEATQNTYAKNQVDSRKGCAVEDFILKEQEEPKKKPKYEEKKKPEKEEKKPEKAEKQEGK